jgi:hypothetical protein
VNLGELCRSCTFVVALFQKVCGKPFNVPASSAVVACLFPLKLALPFFPDNRYRINRFSSSLHFILGRNAQHICSAPATFHIVQAHDLRIPSTYHVTVILSIEKMPDPACSFAAFQPLTNQLGNHSVGIIDKYLSRSIIVALEHNRVS